VLSIAVLLFMTDSAGIGRGLAQVARQPAGCVSQHPAETRSQGADRL
jgi:hypothetical protein